MEESRESKECGCGCTHENAKRIVLSVFRGSVTHMARLLTLDACPVFLRNSLLQILRECDEAILLPQAWRSQESQIFKNIVFRLAGDSGFVDASLFSADWFTGTSLIQLSEEDARMLDSILACPTERRRILELLKDDIPSEIADSSVVVGPPLECDSEERDQEGAEWVAGFDSTSSFVGVFSAEHSKVSENGMPGTNRVHKKYYLVCKAGGGASAATFHSRVLAACENGKSLDDILENSDSPGPLGLRRVSMSATRNRARILLRAAQVIGLSSVTSVPDHAARVSTDRIAVCDVDVSANVIRKLDSTHKSVWQYSASLDGTASRGIVSLSNAGDGLVLFLTSSGDCRISLKNDVWACIPFTSKRLKSAKDMAHPIVAEYKRTGSHPDAQWIKDRFSWRNRQFSTSQPNIEPFALWGSHEPESFAQCFSRELGLDGFQSIRLRPELVCCAGVDAGKLRAIVKGLAPES